MASEDMFRILVATDIHIGYGEKDSVRGQDSFNSFIEVLEIAKEQKVDFILLAGDLFHDNRPSPKCLIRCTEALRMYCLGDEPVHFQLISNQKENFNHSENFPYVNFEEKNLNVSLPVFSIHGNHDDPTGKNPLCFLEALSASGLVNYFGKYMNIENIDVKPLLMQKGKTKIAMYGLGSLPEERLHRFFLQKKVRFLRPEEDTEKWFNIFVVHQNRVAHGTKYLPEKFLSNLPHLVIWGHEHESKPELDYNPDMGFHVLQPGSTVATSLCPAESEPKHVFLLEIVYDPEEDFNRFKVEPIPLKTVRPFMFKSIDMDDELSMRGQTRNAENVLAICEKHIKEMIDKAEIEHTGDERQPKLPIIRLKIEATFGIPFSIHQLGMNFKGKVANPGEMILYKVRRPKKSDNKDSMDQNLLSSVVNGTEGAKLTNIEDIVSEYFAEVDDKAKLSILSERDLTIAIKDMVDKDVPDNIENALEKMLENVKAHLMKDSTISGEVDSEIMEAMKEYQKQSRSRQEADFKKLAKGMSPSKKTSQNPVSEPMEVEKTFDDDSEEIEYVSEEEAPKQRSSSKGSRGRGRGRGSRGGRKPVYTFSDSD